MQKKHYIDYYKTHEWYGNTELINNKVLESRINTLQVNLDKIINPLNRNIKILEIWCGQWHFAEYVRRMNFINYVGFDFDTNVIESNKKIFPDYQFFDEDVLIFLENNKDKFDIIFLSHVYEHMTVDEWKILARHIYDSLNKNWIWINIMPNAGALFSSSCARYTDITHKILYTSSSFNQILLHSWFQKWLITHKNTVYRYSILEYWQRFFRFFCFLLYRSLGYLIDKVTTYEILSIIKK